jgi:4-hydroxy 2-oxovalerate aldolase
MRYTDDELELLVSASNEMGAYALYFVDSFGYMEEKDVERFYRFYAEKLDPNIRIGFHAHNNMENAMFNVKNFIEHSQRNCIIDSCAIGMGQGAGNLQTEVLVSYLNKNFGTRYGFNSILAVCEMLEKFRPHDLESWGYSPVRLIPAVHSCAYKYAVTMKLKYGMSLVEINNALGCIPDDLRHRYTPENLERVLKIYRGEE